MSSLIEELKRREEAARAEADQLRSRMEQVARDLAKAEERVSRLVIAQEEIARVLDEPASHVVLPGRQDGPAREPEMAAGRGSPIAEVAVPPWRADLEAGRARPTFSPRREPISGSASTGARMTTRGRTLRSSSSSPTGESRSPRRTGPSPSTWRTGWDTSLRLSGAPRPIRDMRASCGCT
jgi:hypothetical protein